MRCSSARLHTLKPHEGLSDLTSCVVGLFGWFIQATKAKSMLATDAASREEATAQVPLRIIGRLDHGRKALRVFATTLGSAHWYVRQLNDEIKQVWTTWCCCAVAFLQCVERSFAPRSYDYGARIREAIRLKSLDAKQTCKNSLNFAGQRFAI
eukprot:1306085-Rhodomonas_salina.2